MSTLLSNKALGSSIFLEEDGSPVEYIVAHHGLPSAIYDNSCDGTWVFRKDLFETRQWHSSNVNDYANSTIHSYLNSTFLARFSQDVQAAIQSVKLPYRPGSTSGDYTVNSGANGLSCKLFFLSMYELGFTTNDYSYLSADGAKLDYFDNGTGTAALAKRIGYLNGTATYWWSRSPRCGNTTVAMIVNTSGSYINNFCSVSYGVRPALILPSSLLVSSDGSVASNAPPTISGVDSDLGAKTVNFSQNYIVTDDDGDTTTVVEKIDGTLNRSFTATLGGTVAFDLTDSKFTELSVGSHTLSVEATDSEGGTASRTFTFSKVKDSIELSLSTPLECDSRVSVGSLTVTREIASGATFQVEACNNANDSSPTWEDVTQSVLAGVNFTLENEDKTASDWGYNVRITSKRNGATGDCWISYVGGFFK